ncbi:MAG: hypothetical protein R3D01_05700 [Hyphomicrobiales bacterium]
MYGEGISKTGELIDLGVKAGIVEEVGLSWFSFDSERIGQGRENAKTYLKEHPETAAKIERAIRQNAGLIAEQILEGELEGTLGLATPGLAMTEAARATSPMTRHRHLDRERRPQGQARCSTPRRSRTRFAGIGA